MERSLPVKTVRARHRADSPGLPEPGTHGQAGVTRAGNRAIANSLDGIGRLRQQIPPAVQRFAEFQSKSGFTQEPFVAATWITAALTENSDNAPLIELLPTSLRVGKDDLNIKNVASTLTTMTDAAAQFGLFDLQDSSDIQNLFGLLAHLDAAAKRSEDSQPVESLPTSLAASREIPEVARNKFRVISKPREEVLTTLQRWNAYFSYKRRQLEGIRSTDSDLYETMEKTDAFKNFTNIGTMIGMVTTSLLNMDATEYHETVRVAVNPDAADQVAAILIYLSRPDPNDATNRAYVADLLANPKSIKPDRNLADYKAKKKENTDPTTKGGGRAVLSDASRARGGGNALLQHAVLESGRGGIELFPLDETTQRIYKGMRFGTSRFQPMPGNQKRLMLSPQDIDVFAKHATGSLLEAIEDWRRQYG